MIVSPSFADFAAAYASGRSQLVWTTIVADLETPVSAMLKLAANEPNAFLLESVEGGAVRGRYSFIGLKPDLIWRSRGGTAEVNRDALTDADAFAPCAEPPLAALRGLLKESRIETPEHLPPMASGLFGYLGYDMVRHMERLPDDNPDTLDVDDALLIRPSILVVFDRLADSATLVAPAWPRDGVDAERAYEDARQRLYETVLALETRNLPHAATPAALEPMPAPVSNMGEDAFMAAVERAKEYIRAGDVFQVVLSHRFSAPFPLPPFALYRALRRLNPSPFLFYLNFKDFSVVGSSPEILVRLRDGEVTIRPLAGTRPRGATPEADAALETELLADPKELAEHLMLIDLARNDVGRVAKIGSVRVPEKFKIERYSHVMHISSTVVGELTDGADEIDAFVAGFPAGTLSGAPKVRAMEIIDELEVARRGVYGGAVGYFGGSGALDSCIALRTAVIKDGVLHVQAGAGVVADSDPKAEYQETCAKARAVVRAAEEAVRYAMETRDNG